MRFLSWRELRNTPAKLWKALRSDTTIALTANGVPKALVIGVEENDLETALLVARRVRAELAVTRMRARAREAGADRLGSDAIDAEVRAARQARRR